jgi:predicted O-methyltransferase YrrM
MYHRRRPLHHPLPWITFSATREILKRITPASAMFEFGGGNSTLYWARRVASVCVTEDNDGWLELLRKKLESEQIRNVQLNHGASPASYAGSIAAWPRDFFDVVVVDGAYRRDCVKQAIAHVKPGGLLVVDNTDWHWFKEQPLHEIPADWRRMACAGYAPMMGYRTETTLYLRPAIPAAAP